MSFPRYFRIHFERRWFLLTPYTAYSRLRAIHKEIYTRRHCPRPLPFRVFVSTSFTPFWRLPASRLHKIRGDNNTQRLCGRANGTPQQYSASFCIPSASPYNNILFYFHDVAVVCITVSIRISRTRVVFPSPFTWTGSDLNSVRFFFSPLRSSAFDVRMESVVWTAKFKNTWVNHFSYKYFMRTTRRTNSKLSILASYPISFFIYFTGSGFHGVRCTLHSSHFLCIQFNCTHGNSFAVSTNFIQFFFALNSDYANCNILHFIIFHHSPGRSLIASPWLIAEL